MEGNYLYFEGNIAKLDHQIKQLTKLGNLKGIDYSGKIKELEEKRIKELGKIYSKLNGWQTVKVARHPQRPIFQDYLKKIITDFHEMHGDRDGTNDPSIITGLGKIGGNKLMIVANNKGKTLEEKAKCNFGCANPEGYRKALEKMKFAEKYGIPVVTLIDTPGANPGIHAEEKGQAHAIAVNLKEMSRLKVPIICIVIGEGGSGGALGIGVGDRLAMLKHAYYSVISPEGCAAILWRDAKNTKYVEQAADALKLRSKDLSELGLIDEIIPEPLGGAHRNITQTCLNVKQYVDKTLPELMQINTNDLVEQRYEKLRAIGQPA